MLGDEIGKALTGLSIYTAILGLIALAMRSWIVEHIKDKIKYEFEIELETHKDKLKSQSDGELERLRSALALAAAERNVVFSHLQEKRAKVIAKEYALMKRIIFRVSDYVKKFEPTGGASREERSEEAYNA